MMKRDWTFTDGSCINKFLEKMIINSKAVRINISMTLILVVSLISCKTKMTSDELKSYLIKEENGLMKKVRYAKASVKVSYYPSVLFKKIEGNLSNIDSIDYFVISTTSYNLNNHRIDLYGSLLLVDKDTLQAIDALYIPGANIASRNSSMLLAFKSYLNQRKGSAEKIFLVLDEERVTGERIAFLISDIKRVQSFEIIK